MAGVTVSKSAVVFGALGGIVLVIGLVVGAVLLDRWRRDSFNEDQPPEVLSGSSTSAIVESAEPVSGIGLVTEGRAPVTRRGRTEPLPLDSPERRAQRRYVADVLDSQEIELPDEIEIAPGDSLPPPAAPGLLPVVRVIRDGDRGAIAAMDSRGAWQVEEQRCPEGRRWEAGTTLDGAGFYGNCERAVPALLPSIGKTALVCGATAAAGAGIAIAAGYDHPEYVAGGAATVCVLIRIS